MSETFDKTINKITDHLIIKDLTNNSIIINVSGNKKESNKEKNKNE